MAEMKALSSLAHREAYLELVPQFERTAGHSVSTTWAGTIDIMKRLAAGEIYDLVIVSSTSVDELIKSGKASSRTDLAKTGIGVAVRAGAPKPDIGTAEALKRALLAAKTVGYSTGPSGVYLAKLFERMGIAAEVKAKTRQIPSGGTVATLLTNGEAEIGFQQVSELVHVSGVDFIAPLPPEVQHVTMFSCCIPTGAKNSDATGALIKFLTAPAADMIFKKHGLDRP